MPDCQPVEKYFTTLPSLMQPILELIVESSKLAMLTNGTDVPVA